MKEVSYWVADDGTKFDEEKDCFNYEWKQKFQKVQNNGLKIFDRSHTEITNWDFDAIYDAFGVLVLTLDAARFFVKWSDDYGAEAPFSNYDISNASETKFHLFRYWRWWFI